MSRARATASSTAIMARAPTPARACSSPPTTAAPTTRATPPAQAGVLATWDGTTVADNGGNYLATNDPQHRHRRQHRRPGRRPARLHRRLEPAPQGPALRSHRPRRHPRQPEPRHRPGLGHRLRRQIRHPPRAGSPAPGTPGACRRDPTPTTAPTAGTPSGRASASSTPTPRAPLPDAHARAVLRFPRHLLGRRLLRPRRRSAPTTRCRSTTAPSTASWSSRKTTPRSSPTPSPRGPSRTSGSANSKTFPTGARPTGHGGGLDERSRRRRRNVSDPFLVNGFSRVTLHLRNNGGSAVPVEIEIIQRRRHLDTR